MKVFVLCICVLMYVSFILAGPMQKTLLLQRHSRSSTGSKIIDDCLNQVGMQYVEDYDTNNILNIQDQPGMEEKRRKYGCIIECLLKKAQWMEGTELQEDIIYRNITKILENSSLQAKAQKLVRDCAKKVRDTTPDKCEKGVTVMVCVTKGVQGWDFVPMSGGNDQLVENQEN